VIVHKFKCTTKSDFLLLVPTKEIPETAKHECTGKWVYAGELSEDLKDTDTRLALDSKKAVEDINKQGFHIAKYSITSTTTVLAKPKGQK
jgi:hypothetical protein